MTLQSQFGPVSSVFDEQRCFAVAAYQRRYEWTLKEMDLLLEDLAGSFTASKSDPHAFHFIGSFIFQSNADNLVQVVDGQQRLVSLSIILAVARDLIADKTASAEVDQYLTMTTGFFGTGRRQRLTLHRGDQVFFDSQIVPRGATTKIPGNTRKIELDDDAHERMRRNAIRARDWIGDMAAGERVAFIRFVLRRCQVIQIIADRSDDAFQIFETVNNRGRPISDEDVLRFALIDAATDDMAKRDALAAQWNALEEKLGPDGMKQFIGQWRQQFLKGRRSNKSLKRDIIEGLGSRDKVLAFLEQELASDVDQFAEITNGDVSGIADPEVKYRIDKSLVSLGLTDFQEWQPIATLLVDKLRARDPNHLAMCLASLDRLSWYFYLRYDEKGIDSDRRDRMKLVLAHVADSAMPNPADRALDLSPDEAAEMRDILQERIDSKWAPLRSLVTRIEVALSRDNLHIPRDLITVEHVLPCNPNQKTWLGKFGNKQQLRSYAERLGNLCAVPEHVNRELADKIFPTKKKILARHATDLARFATVQQVAAEGDWSKDIITARSKLLLKVLCDEFRIHA